MADFSINRWVERRLFYKFLPSFFQGTPIPFEKQRGEYLFDRSSILFDRTEAGHPWTKNDTVVRGLSKRVFLGFGAPPT